MAALFYKKTWSNILIILRIISVCT